MNNNTIQYSEISQLSLKRLFNQAGIKRVKQESYGKLNNFINTFTHKLLDNIVVLNRDKKRTSINEEDVNNGMIIEDILQIINTQNSNVDNFTQVGGLVHDVDIYQSYPSQVEPINIPISVASGGGSNDGTNIATVNNIPTTQFYKLSNNILNNLSGENKYHISRKAFSRLQYLVEKNSIQYLLHHKHRNNILGNKEFVL
jgi:histone H3/H4